MTTEALIAIAVAVAVALVALVSTLVAWRTLGRTGQALRLADDRLRAHAQTLPISFVGTRERLVEVRGGTERALWSLSNLDARLETARTGLANRRAASDLLRERLIQGQATLARLRETARLVMRAIELRRTILG